MSLLLFSCCAASLGGVATSLQFGASKYVPRQRGVRTVPRSQQADQLEWAAREAALLEEELVIASAIEGEEEEEEEVTEAPELLGTLSLYEIPEANSEAAELLEAAEEALQASVSVPTSWPSRRNAIWDNMFWREYAAATEREQSPRVSHFLRVHRIVSLALSGRNRTDFVCRPSPDLPIIQNEDRVATALTFCAGLTSRAFWNAEVCPAWIAEFDAKDSYLDEYFASRSSEEVNAARRRIVFPGLVSDERTDDFLAEDQGSEKDLMTTASGQFGELVEIPPDTQVDRRSIDDDDALAASFRELDALDDDGFFDDGLLIEDEEDAEERAVPDEEPVDPERHGRRLLDLVAYFRQDPGIERENLVGVPHTNERRVSIVSQAPGTCTPLFSEMENMFLSCYRKLEGPADKCGIRSATDADDVVDDIIVIDPTYKHAVFNDGPETAYWLKVDFWHPDLEPSEIHDLHAFLALDEQFLLRRYVGDSVVLEKLFSTDSYLDYIP